MGHSHDAVPITGAGRHRRRLAVVLGFTTAFLIVEAVAGVLTGSLALLADAGHMLTDVVGLALALLAIWWAARPPDARKTYGYYRIEVLAAVINGTVLLMIAFFILWEAYRRFLAPPPVAGIPMLVVATAGLIINVIGIGMLRAGAGESLNVRGAYLEVMGDALGSAGVIVAAIVVLVTGWRRADPLIAAGIGVLIVPRTWRLLRDAINVLMEGTPPHLDVAAIQQAMQGDPAVSSVHDLHIWTLTSGRDAMSGHVVLKPGQDGAAAITRLHDLLHRQFGIEHTTIQVEHLPIVQIKTT